MFAVFELPQWFLYGTIGFYGLVAAWLVMSFLAVAYQKSAPFFASLVVFLLALQFMAGVDVVGTLHDHWLASLALIGVFFCISVGWTLFRWRLFVGDKAEAYKEAKIKFLEENKMSALDNTPDGVALFKDWLDSSYNNRPAVAKFGSLYKTPKAKEYKARIMFWLSAWPFDAAYFIGWDFVSRTFSNIYKGIVGWLQSIADSTFQKHVDKDVME